MVGLNMRLTFCFLFLMLIIVMILLWLGYLYRSVPHTAFGCLHIFIINSFLTSSSSPITNSCASISFINIYSFDSLQISFWKNTKNSGPLFSWVSITFRRPFNDFFLGFLLNCCLLYSIQADPQNVRISKAGACTALQCMTAFIEIVENESKKNASLKYSWISALNLQDSLTWSSNQHRAVFIQKEAIKLDRPCSSQANCLAHEGEWYLQSTCKPTKEDVTLLFLESG